MNLLDLEQWQLSFYRGERLKAEVELFGSAFIGDVPNVQLKDGCAQLQASFGLSQISDSALSPFQRFQEELSPPQSSSESRSQYFQAADCPDALLFWFLVRHLPGTGEIRGMRRLHMLRRTAQLLTKRFPDRPDLPYQLLLVDATSMLLKIAPKELMRPGQFYSRGQSYLLQLQAAWIQGRYQDMWLGSLKSQVDGRSLPLSDHHIRGFSIIGEAERCLELFGALYKRNPSEFRLGSISNILFMALGSEKIPSSFVDALVNHFGRQAKSLIKDLPDSPPLFKRLEVNEKPLLVVVSSDLRNHPVGRFWLPIARHLRSRFRIIHVAGHPHDSDPIRSELNKLSEEWWSFEASEVCEIASRIRGLAPAFLLDLGGHTADNHPALLSHRLASVQATYLGFYGPTYGTSCDWWIIDEVLQRWISSSYPGAERLWPLPGPSLCYVPALHGLPELETINYQQPTNLVFGSFNHTRKITRATQKRFGAVLSGNPDAVLQFRSHSFHDPAVRRYFLQSFYKAGIAPHQLQPLPYAPSSVEAMSDYGRIHLHLDSFPVSGTTTTLDSLAMGIPVLTSPTPFYAGAISSAILEHAGLADHVCPDPCQLPGHARLLAERYRSAAARRSLAEQVRQSPICDDQAMPRMFVEQLEQMLRIAMNAN